MAQTEFTKTTTSVLKLENELRATVAVSGVGLSVYDDGAGNAKVIYARTLTSDESQAVEETLAAHVVDDPLVNYLELVSAASGELPQLKAFGSDADVGIKISPKGIGRLQLYGQRIEGLNYGGYLGFTVTLDSLGDLDYLHIAPGLVGGQAVNLHALGNDADININCIPQGTGRLQVAAIAVPTISSTDTLTNKTITRLILTAGSTTVAPLKLQSGSLLTTPAAGSMEFLTDTLSFTITTGAARKTIPFLETAQTWTAAQTLGTTTKILFTDANAFIHASASGALVLQGTTSTTVGVAGNIIVGGGGTGTIQIGSTSTQLVGVFGATPVVRTAAYTQTYATASRTHPAVTSLAAVDTNGTFGFLLAADRTAVITSINAIRTDLENLKKLVNSIIDDQQAYGWFQ